jgi:hypothetical protein
MKISTISMKKIVKNFNNFIKNIIFKVHNKTNNKLNKSNFNKFLITFICTLFLYIFYLLIPLLYEKNWVKDNIQTKLLSEFKIDINHIDNISYRILPAPHFLITDSEIMSSSSKDKKPIARIKDLKIFLDQMNFFNKEKMSIKEMVINKANFFLLRNDIKFLNDSLNRNFSNKKIKINKSNVFLKNSSDEIITIIKINKANFLFDIKDLQNKFKLKGNIFSIPFTLEVKTKNDLIIEKKLIFKAKSLNLNIFNNYVKKNDKSSTGSNSITFLNSTINTQYKMLDENFVFTSKNPKINYDGELSINPFDLDLNVSLDDHKISKLFNFNPILVEFLTSGLLFNENISLNTSIKINANNREKFFDNAKIHFNILNGLINLDDSELVNDNIGSLKLKNSNFFLQDDNLILNTILYFDIKNSNRLFSFLNTNKRIRKTIKNIIININYDFLNNEIEFNNVKIDNNETSQQFMNIIDGFKDNDLNNLIKSRRLLNELMAAYEG